MAPSTPTSFTVDQLAAHLGTTRDTILRAIRSGDLAAVRDGAMRWRIEATDVPAYLTSIAKGPHQESPPMNNETIVPRTMSLQEAAVQIGITLWELQEGCRKDRISHYKFSKTRRMSQEQVDEYLASKKRANQVTSDLDEERNRRAGRRRSANPARKTASAA
jgi:excisionase family DNA binding protein